MPNTTFSGSMANSALLVLLFPIVASLLWVGKAESYDWRRDLGLGRVKVTRLHFYFHDYSSGPAPTAVKIAQTAKTDASPTSFGKLVMADDLLTLGPEPNSQEVGRAQGMYGYDGREKVNMISVLSFWFTHGKYNGSSFSLLSQNTVLIPVRELAIVGGTGQFRLAQGVAVAKTYFFNLTAGIAIVEYNVTLVHY